VIGRGIAAIRPLKGVFGEYLFYFFRTHEQKIAGLGTGSTFKAITQETLKKVEVPCPSKDEQIRIATLLSRVEALINTRKENLRLLDDFLKSFSRPCMAIYPKGTLLRRQVLLFHQPDASASEAVRTLVPLCPLKSLVERFATISLVT
jgi:hypothetical protein